MLAVQGIEGDCVFVYGYEYAFVRGYVDECGMWFWLSYYVICRIEFNNRDTKSKSKIAIQN